MTFDYDIVVIGSGFGGSVMTCRLTEKGYKVCLLERGKRYGMNEFPRRMDEIKEKFFWDPKDNKFGYLEFRDYPDSDAMSVAASGLGGGSLVYANVLLKMPEEFFEGWPGKIQRSTLEPYYDKVISTMEASPYPFHSHPYYNDTSKTKRLMEACKDLDLPPDCEKKPEFLFPHLAIRFQGKFPGEQSRNSHGALQSSCIKCGECDVGCNVHAKNTLDLNYIYRAEHYQGKNGPAIVKTECEVVNVIPLVEGFEIHYCHPKKPYNVSKLISKKVIISAGALRSTELLLKMKRNGHLPKVSPLLGKKICGNGDLIGFALGCKKPINPTLGPVITGAIRFSYPDYPDRFKHGLFIEDAGFPIGWSWYLAGKVGSVSSFVGLIKMTWRTFSSFIKRLFNIPQRHWEINFGDDLAAILDNDHLIRHAFMLLGMGRDRSDGELYLSEEASNKGEPILKWNREESELHIQRTRSSMRSIAESLGGHFFDNPLTSANKIVTVHPLGGCIMGDNIDSGVVSTKGEIFGCKGLYVVDGSILPTSLGSNPSLTIAAIAEYIADQFEKNL